MFTARPRVADLVFRLYDRPLHPELFDTLAERRVRWTDYALTVRLTPTGHVVEYSRKGAYLLETTAAVCGDLPAGERLAVPFRQEKRGRCLVGGVRYQVSVQAEVLPPHLFPTVHNELAADAGKDGVFFRAVPHRRLGLAPLGLVRVAPLPTGLCVSTFHTFPAEHTVLKTQSLIEPVTLRSASPPGG